MKKHRLVLLGLCVAAAVAFAADATRTPARSYKFRENVVEGIPKEWGRLVNAGSFTDSSTVMFFEATAQFDPERLQSTVGALSSSTLPTPMLDRPSSADLTCAAVAL